jgi:hypothetical protein
MISLLAGFVSSVHMKICLIKTCIDFFGHRSYQNTFDLAKPSQQQRLVDMPMDKLLFPSKVLQFSFHFQIDPGSNRYANLAKPEIGCLRFFLAKPLQRKLPLGKKHKETLQLNILHLAKFGISFQEWRKYL